MPHERMQGSYPAFDLNVSWSRDCGYVQVATSTEEPEHVKRMAAAIAEGAQGESSVTLGVFVDLDDRRKVNDLIRVLRRARDQAFGADE